MLGMPEENQIDKIPPQSLEAEMSLLGSILIDKDAMLKIADIVGSSDFYKIAHAKIFETISELYERNEPIDLLTVSNRLEEKNHLENVGGKSYLVSLTNTVPTSSNINNYADIVHRKATRRRLLAAANEINRLGYQENDSIDNVLDEAQRHLFGVSQNYFKQGFIPIRGILTEAFDRIDEMHKNKGQLRGLATGFGALDNILSGLQKSDLIILAAGTSVGKTSLALDIVRHVGTKLKVPVGLFSLEMSKEQLVDRLLCSEANVDSWKLRSGHLSDRPEDNDFARIGHAIGTLSEAPIFFDDSPSISVLQLRTRARRMQAEYGLGLIVIDYLQLMESKNKQESRVQEISEITRGLKSIARELNVPVLALSQLSRAVDQSNPAIPKLFHLRESGSIEQDADVVMFIYRKSADRNFRQEDLPPHERFLSEIHLDKHRNGPTGLVKLIFNQNLSSFRNMETQIKDNTEISASPTTVLKPKSAFAKHKNKLTPKY